MCITDQKPHAHKRGTSAIVNPSLVVVISLSLIIMAGVSIFLVYISLQSTEAKLELAATEDLRRHMSEDIEDVTEDIEFNLDIIARRLENTAQSPVLTYQIQQSSNKEQTDAFLKATVIGKEFYVERLNYLDKNGHLLSTTDNQTAEMKGSDLSGALYYYELATRTDDDMKPIITDVFQDIDGANSIAIAAPLTDSSGNFNGLLAAVMHVDSIVDRAENRLNFENNQLVLVAKNGTTISSAGDNIGSNNQSQNRGINNFVQDLGDTSGNEIGSKNVQLMLEGKSGSFDVNEGGSKKIVAYHPIKFLDTYGGTLILIVSQSDANHFSTVINEQRIFTLGAVVLIGIIATIFIVFIIIINRRLEKIVLTQDEQIKTQLSDLRQTYDKLREQDTIKDEFINIAAHELRTPVLPIILTAEGLAEDLGTDNDKVEIILRNAKRINKLTNDILDVSRIESNTFKLQKDKISINELIEEAIEDARLRLNGSTNSGVTISFDSKLADHKGIIIAADKGRINQVISNLLDNAVNFTDSGSITVTLNLSKSKQGYIEVAIADTGKGIDPAVRDRLFGKFVTKSHRAKGTGLGLYLCKAIIEQHGGEIWAEDNAYAGKGAIFRFTLPIDPDMDNQD